MLESLRVLLTILFVSLLVALGIVSCTRENAKTVGPDTQRDVESTGASAPAAAARDQKAPVPPGEPARVPFTVAEVQVAEAPNVVGAQVAEAPKVVGARAAAAGNSSGPRVEPTIGMSTEEVKASTWGEPIDIVKEEVAEGVIQTWYYGEKRTVQFNHMGSVTNVAP
jgi:hypothetical protein